MSITGGFSFGNGALCGMKMLCLFKAGLVEGINVKVWIGLVSLDQKQCPQNQVQYCI
jgi:hypothetical protein